MQKLTIIAVFASIFVLSSMAKAAVPQPVQAVSAASFVDSLGINTHIGAPNATVSMIASDLNFTGIHHVRDALYIGNPAALQQVNSLSGAKFDLVDGYYGTDGGSTVLSAELVAVAPYANIIESIEGPNEPDYFGIHYNGLTGAPAVVATQQFLYGQVKANTALKKVPVLCPALSYPASGGMASSLGNLAAYCDYATSHAYPENTSLSPYFPAGSLSTPYGFLSVWTSFPDTITAPGRTEFITEGGWNTDTADSSGVDENSQAKYYADYLLDSFRLSIPRTYMYELIDDAADPGMTYSENHYGIFHVDGTPKPAAKTIANMINLLKSAPLSPGSLSYSLDNLSQNAPNLHQLLFQKSDGTFVLAIWNEATLWDSSTRSENTTAPVRVLLNLGQAADITLYDPVVSVVQQSKVFGMTSLTLEVPDHPILVAIVPQATPCLPLDTLNINMSEDAYNGDAQFIAYIDGIAISSAQAVTVHQPSGLFQTFTFQGTWGTGNHVVGIQFINDAYDGTPFVDGHDRNLFVHSIIYDGAVQNENDYEILSNRTANFTLDCTFTLSCVKGVSVAQGSPFSSTAAVTTCTRLDTLNINMSEDAYNGDAQFIPYIDGVAIGSAQAVSVHQPSGLFQTFTFHGTWGAGNHIVGIQFINDAWDGAPFVDGHDRNLFVHSIIYDGAAHNENDYEILSNRTVNFTLE